MSTPDAALLTLTLGIALIFLELNRPGSILPGALGLLLTLLAAASLLHHRLNPLALIAIATATITLALNLYRALPTAILAAATVALILGLRALVAVAPPVHTATALTCGAALGLLAAVLSRIAFRARRAKAVH